jgi:hypothetical protein
MASCTKCGATLVAQARFCATCGSPVTSSSVIPPPRAPGDRTTRAPDPFARTVLSDEVSAPPPLPPAKPVSPMAASVIQRPSEPPAAAPLPSTAAPPVQTPYAQAPSPAVPAGATPYAPPAPPPAHAFVPGTLVLVYWADGNRYPGTVLQVAPHHVFVAFPNGVQQWIDARYVQSGS